MTKIELISRMTFIANALVGQASDIHAMIADFQFSDQVQPPADLDLHAVELPTSPTVQGADDLVIAPSNALDALVSEGDAWEVTDLSSPAGVMFTGHRHQCEAWAFDNCAAGFSIRPHTPS